MNKKKGIVGLALLAVLVGLGVLWFFGKQPEMLRLPGVVEVREVRLGSKLGGRVVDVMVNEGDVIKAGQVLVRLEAPETKAQLEQWQARLDSAKAALKKAENGPRVQEREAALARLKGAEARLERLKRGEREEDIRNARNELIAAEADLRLAQDEFRRVERMYRQNAANASEFDAARSALRRTQAVVDAARARLDRLERGSRPEDIEEADNEVRRLRAEHDLVKEGTRYEDKLIARALVDEYQAKIDELKANLSEAEIRAPGNPQEDPNWRATVEILAVRPGDLVQPGQPVMRILQADDRWVKVYVPETQLGKVRLHQEVEVAVDSYPERRFRGKIIHISGDSEFTPRNVQSIDERKHQVFGVKVSVEDPEGVFKSGMAAEVFVPLAP